MLRGALFMLALSVIELLACLDEGLALERRGLGLLVGLGLLAFWLEILRHALPAWASGRRWIRRGASLQAK